MGGARLCRALFRAERGERREHLCLGSVSRRGSRCSRLPLYRIISSGLEFPLAGGSQGSTESRPTSVKATAWAATQLLEPLERFQKNCSRSWVGRDSVEPCFERSEASAASIFVWAVFPRRCSRCSRRLRRQSGLDGVPPHLGQKQQLGRLHNYLNRSNAAFMATALSLRLLHLHLD